MSVIINTPLGDDGILKSSSTTATSAVTVKNAAVATLSTVNIQKWGRIVSMSIAFNVTAAIAAGGTDIVFGTIALAQARPIYNQGQMLSNANNYVANSVITSSGELRLTGYGAIPADTTLSWSTTFLAPNSTPL
jgi:hypothetical protein